MKLTKISQQWKTRLLTLIPNHNAFLASASALSGVALAAAVIWYGGPHIAWGETIPLADAERRAYLIAFLFLCWLLKFLIIDLDHPNPFHYKDPLTRKKLQELQNRLKGAVRFLKKTTVSRSGQTVSLKELPSYLLIGLSQAGKTLLLANSNVSFILQRQFPQKDLEDLEPSEHCDWWVTREASIIDVPGKYLSSINVLHNPKQALKNPTVLWRFFLRLLKKYSYDKSIHGILIALPLPEIMKQNDAKKYHQQLNELFQRIRELQKVFPRPVPCQILITKCDLLPGFTQFFTESGKEETNQAWGVTLPATKGEENIYDIFANRFNALIKKLNQQLLWRLHQERNPMARPYIKDFPLQVERLKEFTTDFIKQYAEAQLPFPLQGVYLTSAMQKKAETEATIIEQPINTQNRALQIFKAPTPLTRAFFIKQFITNGLITHQLSVSHKSSPWKRRGAILASIATIALIGTILGRDFQMGIQQAYSIQNNISEYQVTLLQTQDPDEQLIKTINLLNSLQIVAKDKTFKIDLSNLSSFYSYKAQQRASQVYQQSLKTILLPEIQAYMGEYLKNPVNKSGENIYATLEAYLMLGDSSHFKPAFIMETFNDILPKTMSPTLKSELMQHLSLSLNSAWNPLLLDTNLVAETRRYLIAMPSFNLASLILKNMNKNAEPTLINLGVNTGSHAVFTSQKISNQMPSMFTGKNFAAVLSQQITLAAQEATVGNWVLGNDLQVMNRPDLTNALTEQLRNAYINNYIDAWETLLANIHLQNSANLMQTDEIIMSLISSNSPLLQLLQTMHDNTYFEPVASASPKLQSVSILIDKNTQSQNQLYQIFASLRSLHAYIQAITASTNERKAAFEAVSNRMQTAVNPDALTQVRIVAGNCPEPIKSWLDNIASDTWRFLMQDAGRYLDTSWQQEVIEPYQKTIANRYPFSAAASEEVDIQHFVDFFGNPGILFNFYNKYLQAYVDTSTADWHWKPVESAKMFASTTTLRRIQHAMRIHHAFFPNGDNKLNVQFALQPYLFGKRIKSIAFNINDKQFVDSKAGATNSHVISWPSHNQLKMTSISLQMVNLEVVSRNYPGEWGLFKLIAKSFENVVSNKQVLLNVSLNENPAKYLLFTYGKLNPFLSLNLRHFDLPQQLTTEN